MKIKCDFCGKEFDRCKSKIKPTNNFCSRDCRGAFTRSIKSTKLKCKICGKEFLRRKSNNRSKNVFCSHECYQKFRKNNGTRKGCKTSEETRKKMSLAVMGSKNHCWGTHHSEEHRKKISEGNKGRQGYWTGKKQPLEMIEKRRLKQIGHSCSQETKEKIRQANSGKRRTKEQREQMSEMMAIRIKEKPNQHTKAKWGYFNSIKNNEQMFYRSSYELEAYKILEKDENVISFKREALRIPYKYNGITRFYLPDILVNYKSNLNKVIEIKAKWALDTERNQIKFKEAKKYCSENNLAFEVWTEKELKIAK